MQNLLAIVACVVRAIIIDPVRLNGISLSTRVQSFNLRLGLLLLT